MKVNFVDLITVRNGKYKFMLPLGTFKVGEKLCKHVHIVIKKHFITLHYSVQVVSFLHYIIISIKCIFNKNRLILTVMIGDLNL